jgi:hypothetical protein
MRVLPPIVPRHPATTVTSLSVKTRERFVIFAIRFKVKLIINQFYGKRGGNAFYVVADYGLRHTEMPVLPGTEINSLPTEALVYAVQKPGSIRTFPSGMGGEEN